MALQDYSSLTFVTGNISQVYGLVSGVSYTECPFDQFLCGSCILLRVTRTRLYLGTHAQRGRIVWYVGRE